MDEFALLIGGVFQEIRRMPERPVDIPHKQVQWFPVVRSYGPPSESVVNDAYAIVTVDPATLPPEIPASVSPRQARLALLAAGKLDAANAAVAASDSATKVAWEFSNDVRRDDPGVNALAAAIGLSSDQIDALFIAASKL